MAPERLGSPGVLVSFPGLGALVVQKNRECPTEPGGERETLYRLPPEGGCEAGGKRPYRASEARKEALLFLFASFSFCKKRKTVKQKRKSCPSPSSSSSPSRASQATPRGAAQRGGNVPSSSSLLSPFHLFFFLVLFLFVKKERN